MGGRLPLFGTTTGRALSLAWDGPLREGGMTRFSCSGEINASMAFDATGRWTGLAARGDDGVDIVYEAA
jgi:hypothetical protein